jgi:hypothetical protein
MAKNEIFGGKRPKAEVDAMEKRTFTNVEVTGAVRLYRTASVWTAGLYLLFGILKPSK